MALSGSFTGTTKITNVQPKIVWSATQSIADNTSTITATLYYSYIKSGSSEAGTWSGTLTINGNTKSATQWVAIRYLSNTFAITHTVTVEHDANGEKTVEISATGSVSDTVLSWTSIAATITLDTIAKTSSLSTGNGTLGVAQTLNVSKQLDSCTHTIAYQCGDTSGTICEKSSSTSISWTPPLSLANQNTSGTSVPITFTTTTYSGDTYIGSTLFTISCYIPDSIKPSCTIAVSDADGYANTYGAYVYSKSRFRVITTPTTAYGAQIVNISVKADNVTYYGGDVTTNAVMSTGTLTITTTVTDARGRTASASTSVNVLAYTAPAIGLLKVHRCNADGTENAQGEYVQVTFSSQITALNNKNVADYTLEYKKSADTTYTQADVSGNDGTYILSGATAIFAADTGSSYDIRFIARDAFHSSKRETVVSTAFVLMHFNKSGNAIAFGKISEEENVFEFGLPVKFGAGVRTIALHPHNLLDNSNFEIAQAGYPAQHGSTWFVADRWEAEQWPNAAMYDSHFAFNANDGGQLVVLQKTTAQIAAKLIGKTITLAVCTEANEILCSSGTVVYDQPVAQIVNGDDWSLQLYFFQSSGSFQLARFIVNAGKTTNIKWVALYEGEYTAETLPPYVPKGYAAELAECQRYFRKRGQVVTVGTQYGSSDSGLISLIIDGMRISPTVTIESISSQGWSTITPSSLEEGWNDQFGTCHSKNYIVKGSDNYKGQTIVLFYIASADL